MTTPEPNYRKNARQGTRQAVGAGDKLRLVNRPDDPTEGAADAVLDIPGNDEAAVEASPLPRWEMHLCRTQELYKELIHAAFP